MVGSMFGYWDSLSPEEQRDATMRQYEQNAAYKMLQDSGPHHAVHMRSWNDRDGWRKSAAKAFPIDTPREEIDAFMRASGWPGHKGRRIDYIRDDLWAWWHRLTGNA